MNNLKYLILKHPVRIKYGLILANVFIVIMAIKIYINYVSIENAIQETKDQSANKRMELAFSENFLLNYERSEFAKYFLQHENNILGARELIVKFEKIPEKILNTGDIQTANQTKKVNGAIASRKQFLSEKMSAISK